jgi:hypothetical protein
MLFARSTKFVMGRVTCLQVLSIQDADYHESIPATARTSSR